MAEGQIIVTGASKGIGLAIAQELEQRGYQVVGLSRSGGGSAGRQVLCDMTDEAAVRQAFANIAAEGPVVGLVNNAGVHIGGATATLSTNDFNKTMALNATAVMVAAREVYPHLKESGGTIVNIGSFFDKMGVPDNLAYCSSKAAVAAMTRCMAVEWAKDGVRVMNVAPGYIETDLNRDFLAREKVRAWMKSRIPMGSPGQPGDVARLVAAIFAENIGFLTGETIYIDGAQGMNH
ncbi:SDR family NAD(P)-dependent oxidoreductase [Sulfitobacter sp. 916]|uniref:SDR family NAD(P)-dependent oxidoreductase n=1 Tax=Sulfitobacter sp. 916 TaxID=3368559 RepID=UPI003746868E|tara:strand:+ start:195 stop:899 length:705 start_codon:yes stop_codon:yes gene_type:complete